MRHAIAAALVLLVACSSRSSSDGRAQPTVPTRTASPPAVTSTAPVATVDERYLSFAVDSAQVVGATWWSSVDALRGGTTKVAPYDFTRPALRALASQLAPAYLRVGGTESDRIYYDMSTTPVTSAPAPYVDVMTAAQWDRIDDFVKAVGLQLTFNVNAGPGSRAADLSWRPDNARVLLQYAASKGTPVAMWELGNEPDAYVVTSSPSLNLTPQQFAADVKTARALVDAVTPGVKLGAPSPAYWPKSGEIFAFYDAFMQAGGASSLDVVTWHYYPQQSDRCPLATLRADPALMLVPSTLDEMDTWAGQVEGQRAMFAPSVPVWLGETGNAQCGGQAGESDAFAGGFWWLDQLARLAGRGEPVTIRHTLSGADYGLIDDATLAPRPDYWTSVLWRRLMGTRVLDVGPSGDPKLRTYAHCARTGAPRYAPGAVTLVVLNLDAATAVDVPIPAGLGDEADAYVLSSPSAMSSTMMLNGTTLTAAADGTLPPLSPHVVARSNGGLVATFPPATYGYVVLPGAGASGCM